MPNDRPVKVRLWFFSVVDVVAALTDSVNPSDYLKKLRQLGQAKRKK